jgi:hypothetical protein
MDWFLRACVAPLARALGRRRLARGRGRALWGVTPILTLPLKAQASAALGFESRTLVFDAYYITRDFDFNLRRLANAARLLGPWAGALFERIVLAWAMLRFDVFHYFLDRGVIRPQQRFGVSTAELDVLAAAGKRVYGFAYGADVRTREATLALGRWNFCVDCRDRGRYCVCDDARGAASMREMSARMTAVVSLGDMLAYTPGARAMHYWPIRLDAAPAPARAASGEPLRIAHAPNHTHFKGSTYLETAIEALRAEGARIDYVKIQGVPNAEVIRLFEEADIVADQFIGGAFGYTALEAMALGRPVLSYVRSPDLVEAAAECPILNVTPDSLVDTLRWCLAHRERLAAIGAQGAAYVRRWHAVEAVAARLGALYRDTGDFPPAVLLAIAEQDAREARRRDAIATREDWSHPFQVTREVAA